MSCPCSKSAKDLESQKEDVRQIIRDGMKLWIKATAEGQKDTVLNLISDEVVFLQPGQPVMTKDKFSAAFPTGIRLEGTAEPLDIQVSDSLDMAYVYSKLSITVFKKDAAPSDPPVMRRAGFVLSVWRREAETADESKDTSKGKWVVIRDANMLTPVKDEPPTDAPAAASASGPSETNATSPRKRKPD